MRISTRGEYGLRVLMELGTEPGTALSLRDIAARQHISLDYLEQIVPSLKAAGLIRARRGAHGGYQLAKAPEEITVFEALTALEGSLDPMACLSNPLEAGEGPSCLASGSCAVQEVWSEMKQAMETVLKKKTLAHMIARQNQNFKGPIRTYSEHEIARLVVLN
jgi:Rrf2 family protein